jgi:hypothetical protein
MPVIFGDTQPDGWLRVTCIQYQMDSHENGHTIDLHDIPEYPKMPKGKAAIQMYNPNTKQWRFDEVDVTLSTEEVLQELVNAVKELTKAIKEK